MTKTVRIGLTCLLLTAPVAAGPAPATGNDVRTIAHVLNRIGFGARPGDIEKVRAIGINRYIDEQLHPERLPDVAMAARLGALASITMSSREISDKYEQPILEKRRQRAANGRQDAPPPSPPAMQDPEQQRAQAV